MRLPSSRLPASLSTPATFLIATASPVPDLVLLLKDGTDGARKFALWSLSLSINKENQATLLEAEAVRAYLRTC